MQTRTNRFPLALCALALTAMLLPGPAIAARSKASKVDLNTATEKELEDLPSVGEATARKIVAGRPYAKVGDLERAGVSKSTIDKISKLVTVGKAKPAPSSAGKAPQDKPEDKPKSKPAAEKTERKPSKQEKASAAPASSGPVNLNTASQKELEDLPGVGPATAKKIIAGRPYSSVNDLARAGVSKSTVGKISSLVTVGAAAVASKPAPSAARDSSAAQTSEDTPVGKPAARTAEAPKLQPPAKGMVWVNTATKVYHYEGDRWYGNTKEGKYMTEDEAVKAGYRASKEGPKRQ
jgi:DNA uptake protein ComE-like DNA-binding protein